ncbi:CaiB/BaiF CoA-transferase family protein [Corynebacterium sp. HMSC30G07]|uniref:CaiB/BaiF CoA transferase family protein n=1 Tax=Corynebacterium sp. HMSC30G07 TaxID=1581072 RepID=UPI000A7F9C9F|nr:CoA transferase [Corynebacterium sp. HMSC30G07]
MTESKFPLPLEGVKILDFTWSVAGPTMTRYLAGLGARVLKVEWPEGPDPMRTAMYRTDTDEKNLNNGAFFSNLNVGKESITINVKDADGLQTVKEIIAEVDAVTESFSAQVMERWGLGYEAMKAINPKIVYVSISGFGHTGPHLDKNTWGPTAQAMSGMTAAVGVPGRDPAGWGYSYLDVCAGYMGAIGATAAILQARKTGESQHVDLSQVETGLALVGPMLTNYLTEGTRPPNGYPGGNSSVDTSGNDVSFRGDQAPLSDIFPTSSDGYNDYVALTVQSKQQWDALCQLVTELSTIHFEDVPKHRAEIAEALSTFLQSKSKYEAAELFASYGIAAAPVQGGKDRVEADPQLAHRGLIEERAHPRLETHNVQSLPYRFVLDEGGWPFKDQFPVLGKDTRGILSSVLNLDQERIDELDRNGVLWPEGVPHEITIANSLW